MNRPNTLNTTRTMPPASHENTKGERMSALLETRDEDDDDGRAALYKDSGTDENEELDDKDADEPISEDEDEDEETDEEPE